MTKDKKDKLKRLKASGEFSVSQMCEKVGISRSFYYRDNINGKINYEPNSF
ncbi:hypothetical protein ACQUW5_08835 [Legionella sp. CNM-1927-20]|uniref:hypothetical protein n=1 Tax=Legionella sp. CNM-1927-20 TaxID=3422221 RepID=UPI00403B085F